MGSRDTGWVLVSNVATSLMTPTKQCRLTLAFSLAFPLFTFQMYQRLGIGWATSLLGFISVAMVGIPFVFFAFGPGIRAKSRYGMLKT